MSRISFTSSGDEYIPDGRITVFVAYAGADGISNYWAAMRLNIDGTPDESFGDFGISATPVFGTQRALLNTSDGGMLMVANGASDNAIERGWNRVRAVVKEKIDPARAFAA